MKKNLTSISTITSKYQTVIPVAVRQAANMVMHTELIWQIIPNKRHPFIMVSSKPKQWSAYLSGLGKEIWAGIDTENYLKQLKQEWRT